jgi:histidyl-tRNA synthetase
MSTGKKLDLQRPTGTRDFLPKDMRKHRTVEKTVRGILESFGFEEVMTPTFEFLDLFLIRSGEKFREAVFSFNTPKVQSSIDEEIPPEDAKAFVLRPEFTAPVCRFYNQNEINIYPKPVKIFYVGPCFRYDKPAPGRFREFFQVGVEMFGITSALADAEIIIVALTAVNRLGINDYILRINDMNILRALLQDFALDEEIQDKVIGLVDKANSDTIKAKLGFLETDPDDIMREYAEDLEKIGLSGELIPLLRELLFLNGRAEHVLPRAKEVFAGREQALQAIEESSLLAVEQYLDSIGIMSFNVDLSIARGLDYYTGIVFEIDSPSLGKQKQICGGGRYDKLIKEFGGDDTPATGFAFGLDRLVLAAEANGALQEDQERPRAEIFLFGFSTDVAPELLKVQQRLIAEGFSVELNLGERKVKSALSFASRLNFHYAMMIGEKEIMESKVTLKNLASEEQVVLSIDAAIAAMKNELRKK